MINRLSSVLADRYRIERELGAGGMATVYLAHDVRHDRKVAIKVLKPELAAVLGAERFVVEIRTTAALSHPHILPLFDSGTADGFLFYVMPYIKGETIREKLNRETQFGVDEAVRIAREVADALDYAHRNGVIHRDIKPENILLHDGRAMVMDFGIALAVSAAAGGRMTETGLSLGTPHYMSPEQATAEKEITGRSDVYSLASVLYEMLAGQPPHIGGAAQQVIMKILTEPAQPVTALRKSVPANVAAAIDKALEKLPADRFESAKEFGAALGDPRFTVAPTSVSARAVAASRSRNRLTVALGALSTVLALLLGKELLTPDAVADSTAPVVRFPLASDASLSVITGATRPFAVSPDGRTIVFRGATDSTTPHLWVRTIGQLQARRLEGTEDGINPAISPDGQTVAFMVQNRSLRTVPIAGGAVRTVATLGMISAALSWSSNDEILLESLTPASGIHRVSAAGGTPQVIVPLDSAGGETRLRRPMMLRSTGIIAYGSTTNSAALEEIALYRPSDGRRVRPGLPGIGPLALIDDRLIYAGALGELMSIQLDTRTMETKGSPVPLSPRVAYGWTGSSVALSEGGTLVYRTENASTNARLDLVDTSGAARSLPGAFAIHGTPRFSPDGRRVVIVLGNSGAAGRRVGVVSGDLWVVDVASGVSTRLTSDASAIHPSWFADGKRLVFSSEAEGRPAVKSIPVDGSSPATVLFDFGAVPRYAEMVRDGRSVLASTSRAEASLIRGWLDGSGRVDTLVRLAPDGIRAEDPRVSPDGRWVAFIERSSYDVWVRSLTGPGMLQVSQRGTEGNPVTWGPDSRRLYYADTEGLHVIELQTTPTLAVTGRRLIGRFPNISDYDLSPDGRTFMVVSPIRDVSDVVVAVNWVDEARRTWNTPASK